MIYFKISICLSLLAHFIAPQYGQYVKITTPMSWSSARSYCQSSCGTDLATITNSGQQSAAVSTCGSTLCWIGYSDIASEGTWRWSDGSSSSYTAWTQFEPSGDGDCAHIWSDLGGTWNDKYCNDALQFLCRQGSANCAPTPRPTPYPTRYPTRRPTPYPTRYPTRRPTPYPTKYPTNRPTPYPTPDPTQDPTQDPTRNPTAYPIEGGQTQLPTTAVIPVPHYVGCYNDEFTEPIGRGQAMSYQWNNRSFDECVKTCNSSKYFGIQSRDSCFCGNDISIITKYGSYDGSSWEASIYDSTDATVTIPRSSCYKEENNTVGGAWTNAVYQYSDGNEEDTGGDPTIRIVLILVGVGFVCCLFIAIPCYCCCRKRGSKKGKQDTAAQTAAQLASVTTTIGSEGNARRTGSIGSIHSVGSTSPQIVYTASPASPPTSPSPQIVYVQVPNNGVMQQMQLSTGQVTSGPVPQPAPTNKVEALPAGWSIAFTPDGKAYYQNHMTKKTQWKKPTQNNEE